MRELLSRDNEVKIKDILLVDQDTLLIINLDSCQLSLDTRLENDILDINFASTAKMKYKSINEPNSTEIVIL